MNEENRTAQYEVIVINVTPIPEKKRYITRVEVYFYNRP